MSCDTLRLLLIISELHCDVVWYGDG